MNTQWIHAPLPDYEPPAWLERLLPHAGLATSLIGVAGTLATFVFGLALTGCLRLGEHRADEAAAP